MPSATRASADALAAQSYARASELARAHLGVNPEDARARTMRSYFLARMGQAAAATDELTQVPLAESADYYLSLLRGAREAPARRHRCRRRAPEAAVEPVSPATCCARRRNSTDCRRTRAWPSSSRLAQKRRTAPGCQKEWLGMTRKSHPRPEARFVPAVGRNPAGRVADIPWRCRDGCVVRASSRAGH